MYAKYSKPVCLVVGLKLKMIFFCFMILCVVASGNILAASYVVDSLGDIDNGLGYTSGNGTNTLRKCIRLANTNVGPDTITFSVSGTISVGSSLPYITDNGTIIDASSQWSGIWPGGSSKVILNGGNVAHVGLVINGASNCIIYGLFITGFKTNGIEINNLAKNNIIGGSLNGNRNIISGNKCGIYIADSGTNNNQVKGNYIGTDANGTANLGNSFGGVYIISGPQDNVIGGSTPNERNIISGNGYGVAIHGHNTNSNQVKGNYIGTDVTGTVDLGNSRDGVVIGYGAQDNVIGGTTPNERNIISGNNANGIDIDGHNTNSNQVKGNYIGTDVNGIADLGNLVYGVGIGDGSQTNTIGGTLLGDGNIIAFNKLAGVKVDGSSTDFNTISHNSIHDNVGLGIDLVNSGNDEIPAPIGTSNLSGMNLNITGNEAGANATVEVFKADSFAIAEGMLYLGSLTADGNGDFTGAIDVTGKGVSATDPIVLTTTHTDGNTSEFQLALPPISIDLTNKMTALGYEIKKEDLGTINQGQISPQYTFNNDTVQNIAFGLNWAGSILKLSVYKPNGSLFKEDQGSPPVIIEVPNAEIGDWKYTITGVDVPNNDYPYAVQVGILKTSTNISLKSGWNMISFPGTLNDPSVDALIPQGSNIIPPFYTYDPSNFSYKGVTEVKPGEGYWALTIADESLPANITPVTNIVLNLKPGWNMIGGVNGNVGFANPQDNPEGSVILPIYTYNPASFGYEDKTNIESGKGYWVLAIQDCTLTLNSNAAPPRNNAIKTYATKPDWIVPVQVITGKGIKEIALGVQSGASDNFDPYMDIAMPPKASMLLIQPEASFLIDSRLVNRLSRDIRKNDTNVTWNMEVESNGGDTELTWNISSLPIDKDMSLQFSGTEIDMRVQKGIKVPSGKHIIAITLKDRVPTKTEAFQNYPNPFNPDTWIPYQLSEAGVVVISIYDVSGSLVRRLDLGHKEAGIYASREKAVHWDGRNEAGERISSGVYFYQIQSGKFSKVMKLVMLK